MIHIKKSKQKGLYYVNEKPILECNLDFHRRGDTFTVRELKALTNFIKSDDKIS